MAASQPAVISMCAVLVVTAGSSCDYVFRLDRVSTTAVTDATTAVTDATPCTPRGHDEDADGVDDACDACPQAGATHADRDGDGVGDACDPNLEVVGDRLVKFFAFDGSDADNTWSRAPEWTLDSEDLVFSGLATESSARLLSPAVVPPFEVQASVTLDNVDRAQRAYFIINGNTSAGIKLECSPEHTVAAGDIVTAYTHSDDASGYDEVLLPTDSYAPGRRFQLRLTARTGTNARMICAHDDGLARAATALINAPPSPAPNFALIARNSVLRVHWLAIYSIPPDD